MIKKLNIGLKIPQIDTFNKTKLVILSSALSLAIVAGLVGYLVSNYSAKKTLLANPEQAIEEQNNKLIHQVAKVYELPQNEKPTVATVKDKEKLKANPLFEVAENGDKILILSKSRRFIVYRPTTNKVVDVIRINSDQSGQVAGIAADQSTKQQNPSLNQKVTPNPTQNPTQQTQQNTEATTKQELVNQTPQPSKATSEPIKVALYNGSKTIGLTKKIEANLIAKGYKVEVTNRSDTKNNYPKSLIIDLTQKNEALVKDLSEKLGYSITTLPQGELRPQGDILIIGGEEY